MIGKKVFKKVFKKVRIAISMKDNLKKLDPKNCRSLLHLKLELIDFKK